MKRLVLSRLEARSATGIIGSVTFSASLTVIHGASDTGKSHVLELVDYAFGSSSIPDIPEASDVTEVVLNFSLGAGEDRRIVRQRDKNIVLYSRLGGGNSGEVESLSTTNAGKRAKLSAVLLTELGMQDWRVFKNQNGDSVRLSFRDLMHLASGSEDRVFSKQPPFISGRYETKTKELSIIRTLMQGSPDPEQTPGASKRERDSKKKQRQILGDLVSHLLSELADQPDEATVRGQLLDLTEKLERAESWLGDRDRELDLIRESLRSKAFDLSSASDRLAEVRESLARFAILKEQYESDISRLSVVGEGAVALAIAQPLVCPFCGSSVGECSDGELAAGGVLNRSAVEAQRVTSLHEALVSTMSGLNDEGSSLEVLCEDLAGKVAELRSEIAHRAEALAPTRQDIRNYQQESSQLQRILGKYEQMSSIQKFRAVETEMIASRPVDSELDPILLDGYSREFSAVLQAWGVNDFPRPSVTAEDLEGIVEGRRRRDRGKGYRSIIYAAQVVALAEFCLKRGLPHPGFVILDSPLVTYKSPKGQSEVRDLVSPDIADNFYRYLADRFPGQAIILENVAPPAGLDAATVHEFSGSVEGRHGFY